MKRLFILAVSICLIVAGCGSKKRTKVNYREAEGYFVHNNVSPGKWVDVITSQDQFARYFGMGTTMLNNPTNINFSKEFAVGIILPETDLETNILIDSLMWNGSKLDLYYSVSTGASRSFTIRPATVLVVDKKYEGKVRITSNDEQL